MPDPARAAYAAGLAMLSRRDLSEAQIRERLARKEHSPAAIEEAVARLRAVRALDDRRVALGAARTEAEVKARGRSRVLRRLQSLGIAADVAQAAADEIFERVDEATLLDRAIARRLRGPSARIQDAAHFRRLLQQLVRQGFSPSLVIRALRARAKAADVPDDDAVQ
jgi:regulatory protein